MHDGIIKNNFGNDDESNSEYDSDTEDMVVEYGYVNLFATDYTFEIDSWYPSSTQEENEFDDDFDSDEDSYLPEVDLPPHMQDGIYVMRHSGKSKRKHFCKSKRKPNSKQQTTVTLIPQ